MRPTTRLTKAAEKYAAARAERDAAIRDAAATMSMRAIAQVVGLSHQRVAQIIRGE